MTQRGQESNGPHNSAPNGTSNTDTRWTTPETVPSNTGPGHKSKKAKTKKAMDPNETGKLLAAKINQLELDAAGEKDQEQEIGAFDPNPRRKIRALSVWSRIKVDGCDGSRVKADIGCFVA